MGKSTSQWSVRSRTLICLVLTAPLLYFMASNSHNLVWNLTESVYFHFAYYEDGPIDKGEYVEFEFSHPIVREGETVRLTKRVACMPGDVLTTKGRYLFCNDKFLGEALPKTESGKLLDAFVLNDVIPEGFVYLSGDSENSFDSRYWGLMDISNLHRVVPLW